MPNAAGLYYFFHPSENRSRPPVILIHGAGGNHLFWPPAVRRLAGSRVYALDLPGHGKSEGIGQQSIPGYTKHISAFMDAVGISHAFVVGHSMGGAIALDLTLNCPERVAALCLVASGACLRVAPVFLENAGNASTIPQVAEAMKEFAYSPHTDAKLKELASKRLIETRPAVLRGDFLACDVFDVRERLGEIRVPTLILVGSDDQMTPVAFSNYMAENIPGAQLWMIENAGHMLMLEKPRQVSQALSGFLEQLVIAPAL